MTSPALVNPKKDVNDLKFMKEVPVGTFKVPSPIVSAPALVIILPSRFVLIPN